MCDILKETRPFIPMTFKPLSFFGTFACADLLFSAALNSKQQVHEFMTDLKFKEAQQSHQTFFTRILRKKQLGFL